MDGRLCRGTPVVLVDVCSSVCVCVCAYACTMGRIQSVYLQMKECGCNGNGNKQGDTPRTIEEQKREGASRGERPWNVISNSIIRENMVLQ